MTISPALKRLLESETPANPAQQEPARMAWKLMTCSAFGMTIEAIAADGGDSPTQGAWRCRSKKIAPVRRTVLSTSDRTSIAGRASSSRTIEQEKQTIKHTTRHAIRTGCGRHHARTATVNVDCAGRHQMRVGIMTAAEATD